MIPILRTGRSAALMRFPRTGYDAFVPRVCPVRPLLSLGYCTPVLPVVQRRGACIIAPTGELYPLLTHSGTLNC